MSDLIIREVQLFMSRPNIKSDNIFYSVAFLNRAAQIVGPKDEKVKLILFRIYMGLFKKIVMKK